MNEIMLDPHIASDAKGNHYASVKAIRSAYNGNSNPVLAYDKNEFWVVDWSRPFRSSGEALAAAQDVVVMAARKMPGFHLYPGVADQTTAEALAEYVNWVTENSQMWQVCWDQRYFHRGQAGNEIGCAPVAVFALIFIGLPIFMTWAVASGMARDAALQVVVPIVDCIAAALVLATVRAWVMERRGK